MPLTSDQISQLLADTENNETYSEFLEQLQQVEQQRIKFAREYMEVKKLRDKFILICDQNDVPAAAMARILGVSRQRMYQIISTLRRRALGEADDPMFTP